MSWRILEGDCRTVLAGLPAQSVHTVVTSPPYFGLRDYGTGAWEGGDPGCDHLVRNDPKVASSTLGGGKGSTGHQQEGFKSACPRCGASRVDQQIGLEPTPDEFVAALVGVFREVRRVLRDDGTVWLNLGDSYSASVGGIGNNPSGKSTLTTNNGAGPRPGNKYALGNEGTPVRLQSGCKPKDLIGIPWMVAFALRADGWYLRSEIIWAKKNCMPESVTDRPTKSHEQIFLLSKSPRYFYDAEAVREEITSESSIARNRSTPRQTAAPQYRQPNGDDRGYRNVVVETEAGRNKRSVWTIATQPYAGAHFATFPPKLIEPCILAGCPEGGTVLDPFAGAGTTGMVALRHNRSFVGIELNAEYAQLARHRICDDAPLFNSVSELVA